MIDSFKWLLIGVVMTLAAAVAHAADFDFPYLGIRLDVPDGWQGGIQGEYLLLGSSTEPGLLALTTHEATALEQLRQVADEGWYEEGVAMQRSGEFDRLGATGLATEFSGVFQGEQAKAYVAAIINPLGKGVSIVAISSASQYGPRQVELVKALADGLTFAAPKEAEHNGEWRAGLQNRKLEYLYSYHSNDGVQYDADGYAMSAYSSISRNTTMHLCADQRFSYADSSNTSFDNSGGFGSSHGSGAGQGRWEVGTSEVGESLLLLHFDSGEEYRYTLSYTDGKTMLNGKRYFRVASDWCG